VIQTIYLPAISVWSVATLANGDIAAATNDGCVRIFTRDESRQASSEVQEIFEAELSKMALAASQELGGMKLSDLPGPEALYEPGARDGQQKMVRSGDKVSVHSWNMAGAYRSDEADIDMDTNSNGGAVVSNKYFPQPEFLYFDSQVKTEPVVRKLKEFNGLVSVEQKIEDVALEQVPFLTTKSSADVDPNMISTLHRLLRWPDSQTFPALDILRASLLNTGCQPLLLEKSSLDEIFSLCLRHLDKSSPPNCQMLALRCLVNLFSSEAGRTMMRLYRDSVISRIMEKLFPVVDDNKNIQTGAATLMLNYAVSLGHKFDDETQVQLMSVLSINFLTFISDWESRFRVLVALGTLLASSPEAVEYGRTLEIKDGVRSWRLLEGSAKVSECAQFLEDIL